jgi:hypothetical protein
VAEKKKKEKQKSSFPSDWPHTDSPKTADHQSDLSRDFWIFGFSPGLTD